jgi:hypothetical protein
MSNSELHTHLKYVYAKQHAFRPAIRIVSKRQAKSQSTGTGQILRTSRVIGISLEKDFNPRAWR